MAQRTASVRTTRVQSRRSRTPRRARASSSTRNEVGRRLTGYVLRFAVNRAIEQRRHRKGETGHSGEHGGSAMGHAVTNALLEELIQEVIEFIVRHNFFMGGKKSADGDDDDRQDPAAGTRPRDGNSEREEPPSQGSHSSTEERRRRRHRRRNEAMVHSLDRLSDELEATYDATVRVLRESGDSTKIDGDKPEDDQQMSEPIKAIDDSLRDNLENLRRATTRCMARVESVRRSQQGSRRDSRHRRAERSFNRAGSGSSMTGK